MNTTYLSRAAIAILLSVNTSCASIVSGTKDDVTVSTTPTGATCNVIKKGVEVAHIERTPAQIIVARSNDDLMIHCAKPGYLDAEEPNTAGVNGWVFGNIVFFLSGVIGAIVDSLDGAAFSYDSETHVTLQPQPQPAPETD